MIISSGWGFLAAFIPAVLFGFAAAVLARHMDPRLAIAFATISSASLVGWLGLKFNQPAEATQIQSTTVARDVRQRARHTMFWIPMQWWSLAIIALGITFYQTQAFGQH